MDPITVINIINLALGILKGNVGGKVNTAIGDIQALEQIGAAVAKQYQALAGKPMDLSLLTYEEPIA